jgi:hypothetical protein
LVPNRTIISEEDAVMAQVTARQPARVIRARRLVPELPELDLKAVRCLYTEEFRNVVSLTEIQRKSLQ